MRKNILKIGVALLFAIAALGCSHDVQLVKLNAPEVTAVAYPGVNYIAWTPVENAKGYKIYRYDESASEGARYLGYFNADRSAVGMQMDDLGFADYVRPNDYTDTNNVYHPVNLLTDGVKYTYYVIAESGRFASDANASEGAGTYVATDALISDSTGTASVKANIPAIYSIVDAPKDVTVGVEGDFIVARFDAKPYLNYKVMLTPIGSEEIVEAVVRNAFYSNYSNEIASAAKFSQYIGEYEVSIQTTFDTNNDYFQDNYTVYPDAKVKIDSIPYFESFYTVDSNTSSPNYGHTVPWSDRGSIEERSFVVEGGQIKYLFRYGRFDDCAKVGYEGADKFTYVLYKQSGLNGYEIFEPELTTGYSGEICYSYFYDTLDISYDSYVFYYLLVKDDNGNILPVQRVYVRPANDANSVVVNNFAATVTALDDDSESDDVRITWSSTDADVAWTLKYGNEDDIATVFNDTANVLDVSDIQPYYVDTTSGTATVRTFYYTKLFRNLSKSDNNYVFILTGSKEGKNTTTKTAEATLAKDTFKPVVDLKAVIVDGDVTVSWGPADLDIKRNFKYTLYRAAYDYASTPASGQANHTITSEYTLVASTDASLVGESNVIKADALGNFVVEDPNLPDDTYTYVVIAEGSEGIYPAGKADISVTGNTVGATTLSSLTITNDVVDGKLKRTLSWEKLPADSIYNVYTIYRAKADVTVTGTAWTLNGLLSKYEAIACSTDENTAIYEEFTVNNTVTGGPNNNWQQSKVTYKTVMNFVDTTATNVYDYVYYVVATSAAMEAATPDQISNAAKNARITAATGLTTVDKALNNTYKYNIAWDVPQNANGMYLPVEYTLYYQEYALTDVSDLKADGWKTINIPAPVNGRYYVVADLTSCIGKFVAFNLVASNTYDDVWSNRWTLTSAPFTAIQPVKDSVNGYAVEYGKIAGDRPVIAITLWGKGFTTANLILNVAQTKSSTSANLDEQYKIVPLETLNRKGGTFPAADVGSATGEEHVTYYWPIDNGYMYTEADAATAGFVPKYLSVQLAVYGYNTSGEPDYYSYTLNTIKDGTTSELTNLIEQTN